MSAPPIRSANELKGGGSAIVHSSFAVDGTDGAVLYDADRAMPIEVRLVYHEYYTSPDSTERVAAARDSNTAATSAKKRDDSLLEEALRHVSTKKEKSCTVCAPWQHTLINAGRHPNQATRAVAEGRDPNNNIYTVHVLHFGSWAGPFNWLGKRIGDLIALSVIWLFCIAGLVLFEIANYNPYRDGTILPGWFYATLFLFSPGILFVTYIMYAYRHFLGIIRRDIDKAYAVRVPEEGSDAAMAETLQSASVPPTAKGTPHTLVVLVLPMWGGWTRWEERLLSRVADAAIYKAAFIVPDDAVAVGVADRSIDVVQTSVVLGLEGRHTQTTRGWKRRKHLLGAAMLSTLHELLLRHLLATGQLQDYFGNREADVIWNSGRFFVVWRGLLQEQRLTSKQLPLPCAEEGDTDAISLIVHASDTEREHERDGDDDSGAEAAEAKATRDDDTAPFVHVSSGKGEGEGEGETGLVAE